MFPALALAILLLTLLLTTCPAKIKSFCKPKATKTARMVRKVSNDAYDLAVSYYSSLKRGKLILKRLFSLTIWTLEMPIDEPMRVCGFSVTDTGEAVCDFFFCFNIYNVTVAMKQLAQPLVTFATDMLTRVQSTSQDLYQTLCSTMTTVAAWRPLPDISAVEHSIALSFRGASNYARTQIQNLKTIFEDVETDTDGPNPDRRFVMLSKPWTSTPPPPGGWVEADPELYD